MLQTKQLMVVIGVLAAGTTGAYHWGQSTRKPPKPQAVQVPNAIPDEESIQETSTAQVMQKPASNEAFTPPAAAEPQRESSPRQPKRDAPSFQDQAAHTDAIFTNQRADPRWAPGTARELDERLRGTNPTGSTLQSVECRTDLCKALISHKDEGQFRSFSDKVSMGTIWDGAFALVRDSDSTSAAVRTMMFFSKPGVELPVLE